MKTPSRIRHDKRKEPDTKVYLEHLHTIGKSDPEKPAGEQPPVSSLGAPPDAGVDWNGSTAIKFQFSAPPQSDRKKELRTHILAEPVVEPTMDEAERTGQGLAAATPVTVAQSRQFSWVCRPSPVVKISTFPRLQLWESPSHHRPPYFVIRAVRASPSPSCLDSPSFLFVGRVSFPSFLVTPSSCCS